MYTVHSRKALSRLQPILARRHASLPRRTTIPTRSLVTTAESTRDGESTQSIIETSDREAWLFVDSVFPIRLGAFDLRHYIGLIREESLLSMLETRLSQVKAHGFRVQSLEPYHKDGGVFVRFTYTSADSELALQTIKSDITQHITQHEGLPTWTGFGKGNVWLVRGRPWTEDMNRFPSNVLKVDFEGPDVQQEDLYDIFRPYGRITDIVPPTPVPAGAFRSASITFRRVRSAVAARNVMHGHQYSDGKSMTRLHTLYIPPLHAHAVRDWLTSHPRIVLPVILFFLGTLTYTIFDPVRTLLVEAKILNWFNYKEYALYKWLRSNTVGRFSFITKAHESAPEYTNVWKERKEAEGLLKSYLSDLPTTVAFVHGPQGSGKTSMLTNVIGDVDRKTLIIDCEPLNKATSDAQLLSRLAEQTGYWPVFASLNSVNNMIDMASVGLIGQKAGFSTSLQDQLKELLEVVGTALKKTNASLRQEALHQVHAEHELRRREAEAESWRERIRNGSWHDGRLDCVAGNGVMSELGIGDEPFLETDIEKINTFVDERKLTFASMIEKQRDEDLAKKQKRVQETQAVQALPVVVIKNFATNAGAKREELQTVLAQWAANLVENQVAHVIVVSDNRENSKQLARALPSKPLNTIALYDADAPSALAFVKQRLYDAGVGAKLSGRETAFIERLGGRASDLESMIHKVKSGMSVEEAVEDIIARAVGELRKNAFGDDIEYAKSLPWSREQAWTVLKQLVKKNEIPYYNVLLEFPFKGDEASLRAMEHSELISIGTSNGRPSTIRPGRPVFRCVFERLVNDAIFQATQDIAFNDKLISSQESTIRSCESELATLKEISSTERASFWGRRKASSERRDYLFKKIAAAQTKIQELDKRTAELKKVLAKGDTAKHS
ncbi:hypothetical protein CONPUDRAFT_135128 [Coniophora puteana RWD-64-598 SS2]|uniref:Mitochondrial escape protein 2 n=1 Tax=Coniophora puteana (strain RWD-64-598) TaxID=741705 RepID=A0A5M3N1U6_CONPW|nr:uncharacterized protein CONPUDRAFT_135128 [Coniophora puteana RWD-64-598 SS2]EIW85363.1 hypothetical protein CONPUDRAFT_135128 [Coniophora puteana RWD-64-598 SS2]